MKLTQTFLDEINDLTQRNCHTEALIKVAEFFKEPLFAEIFKTILKIQMKEGHLPYEYIAIRYVTMNQLFSSIKKKYGEKTLKKICDVL